MKNKKVFTLITAFLSAVMISGCGGSQYDTGQQMQESQAAAAVTESVESVEQAGEADSEVPAGMTSVAEDSAASVSEWYIEAANVKNTASTAGAATVVEEITEDTDKKKEIIVTVNSDGKRLSNDSSGFVLLSEAVPDIILEIRYYSTFNFVGDRIDGYEEPVAILTEEAADALKEVSDELVSKGYRLKVFDAYRPQDAVNDFVDWANDEEDTRMKAYFYPDLEKDELFQKGYISKYSGHSRGSTVDLTLFDMSTEKDVDMGGTFDYFGRQSHPDYMGVTDEQYANRMTLRDAMCAHGFKPINTEWWHFRLEDEPYPDTYFTFPVNSESVE